MKLLNRKSYTSLAAGMAIMFATAQPAQAAIINIAGFIDAFNTAATPLTDAFGDNPTPSRDWTGYAGLAVGNTVQMSITYDESDVTGIGQEQIAFSDITVSFFDSLLNTVLTYIPDSTEDDAANFLWFEDGIYVDADIIAYDEDLDGDDSLHDYIQFGGDDFFSIYDEDSDDFETILQGHWNPLPPVTTVPVPAAVWLFGSGLIGLVGVARRRI